MTIRFIPDTLRDALWRPVAMAAPNGQVYVETASPDLRFVFIGLLLLALLLLAWRRKLAVPMALWVVLALVATAFVPWLLTSGNGRYFIPVLLLAGPLCLGLLCCLPVTRGMKAALALLLFGLQAFVVFDAEPLGIWAMARWRGDSSYFQVSIPPELKDRPHTFVGVTSISYSLIAPQFHPASAWINIANLGEASTESAGQQRATALLRRHPTMKLILPVVPGYRLPNGQPSDATRVAVARMLAAQRLELWPGKPCLFMPSQGMAAVQYGDLHKADPQKVAESGFWVCDVRRNEALSIAATSAVQDQSINRVFDAVEKVCPRLFTPGQTKAHRIDGGYTRGYTDSDMKLYVMDDGWVYYKYWIALNPMEIAKVADVLAPGFNMNCHNIRGRSGLPWEREI